MHVDKFQIATELTPRFRETVIYRREYDAHTKQRNARMSEVAGQLRHWTKSGVLFL